MGSELYRMIRDGAPATWTAAMRMVAWVIADDARDPSQGSPEDGGWPWSTIEMSRYQTAKGEWHDGLTERTGLSEHTIRGALTELGRAGYEMREQIAADRNGRPVFAFKHHAVRYRVPPLQPRQSPVDSADLTTQSPVDSADLTTAEGPPYPAAKGRAKARRFARKGPQILPQRPTDSVDPVSPGLPRVSPPPHPRVVNSNLEGDRPAAKTTTTRKRIPRTDVPESEWVCARCGAKAADGVRFAVPPDLCADCAAKAETGP